MSTTIRNLASAAAVAKDMKNRGATAAEITLVKKAIKVYLKQVQTGDDDYDEYFEAELFGIYGLLDDQIRNARTVLEYAEKTTDSQLDRMAMAQPGYEDEY